MIHELLSLERPLVGLDLETTGVSPKVDRIIQIGIIKIQPDGTTTEWEQLLNPEMPIPPEASAVHGITDEMVADAPKFADIARKLYKGLEGCDILGYNVASFDKLFLEEEFLRLKVEFQMGKIIDCFRIFQRLYPRNLSAAHREFVGSDFEGAHDALTDVRAAIAVAVGQLQRHGDVLGNKVDKIHEIFFEQIKPGHLDPEGKIVWRGGEACLNFGQHSGTPLCNLPRGYLTWMANGKFNPQVKKIVQDALQGRFPVK